MAHESATTAIQITTRLELITDTDSDFVGQWRLRMWVSGTDEDIPSKLFVWQEIPGVHSRRPEIAGQRPGIDHGRVAEVRRVADQHGAVRVELRLAVESARRQALGAVTNELASLEQLPHERVGLEALCVEVRVAVG